MNGREERKKKLRDLAKESKKFADEVLESELRALMDANRSDLEKLRPKVTNEATYSKIIAAVEESTRCNESLAELKDRIEKLGSEVVVVIKEAAKLLKYV